MLETRIPYKKVYFKFIVGVHVKYTLYLTFSFLIYLKYKYSNIHVLVVYYFDTTWDQMGLLFNLWSNTFKYT